MNGRHHRRGGVMPWRVGGEGGCYVFARGGAAGRLHSEIGRGGGGGITNAGEERGGRAGYHTTADQCHVEHSVIANACT